MKALLFLIFVFLSVSARADDLQDSISAVRAACAGIVDELESMKLRAGINTAITGAGTIAAGGAVYAGGAKGKLDAKLRALEDFFDERKIADSYELYDYVPGSNSVEAMTKDSNLSKGAEKSKKLGNIRTGLIAGSAATNIAGAVIAGTNKVGESLSAKIKDCAAAADNLSKAALQARAEESSDAASIAKSQEIAFACRQFSAVDTGKIDNMAKGAMIVGAVGAGTGIAGTVTSAMANSDAIRGDDSDKGKAKEKNLNTSSNVLSGATGIASLTATIFNASQISAIKKAAEIAKKCKEALK